MFFIHKGFSLFDLKSKGKDTQVAKNMHPLQNINSLLKYIHFYF